MFTWYIMMTSPVFQLTPGYYTVTWSPFSYMPASLFLNRSFKDGAGLGFFLCRPRSLKQGHLFTPSRTTKLLGFLLVFFFQMGNT